MNAGDGHVTERRITLCCACRVYLPGTACPISAVSCEAQEPLVTDQMPEGPPLWAAHSGEPYLSRYAGSNPYLCISLNCSINGRRLRPSTGLPP